jgi:hypothetical protein
MQRQKLVRIVGRVASGLMLALVLGIFVFILRTERAHDEAKCPFEEIEQRAIGEANVIEEGRRCLPELEERRWLVSRGAGEPFELGRKRLPRERFEAERAKWQVTEDAENKVILRLEIDGALLSEFREADHNR